MSGSPKASRTWASVEPIPIPSAVLNPEIEVEYAAARGRKLSSLESVSGRFNPKLRNSRFQSPYTAGSEVDSKLSSFERYNYGKFEEIAYIDYTKNYIITGRTPKSSIEIHSSP